MARILSVFQILILILYFYSMREREAIAIVFSFDMHGRDLEFCTAIKLAVPMSVRGFRNATSIGNAGYVF